MKRYYFINHSCGNGYDYELCYTDDHHYPSDKKAFLKTWDRISERKCINLCILERGRRQFKPELSGRAPVCIHPYTGPETPAAISDAIACCMAGNERSETIDGIRYEIVGLIINRI